MKHLLSIEQLSSTSLEGLIDLAKHWKQQRQTNRHQTPQPLQGQVWAMIFTKSSTRTRVSFEVGLRDLGAAPMFLAKQDIQLGRGEPIEDMARVLGRMVDGAIIRTFAQNDVETFAQYAQIPTINALTDQEHPCQLLADLLTIKETFGSWDGLKIAFIGDGFNNMTRSWFWAAKHLGFELVVASPKAYQATSRFLDSLQAPNITLTDDPLAAVMDANVINTDVWLSMGEEDQTEKEGHFSAYQINARLLTKAAKSHIVLHCLPAYRGKEITAEVLEQHASTIFQQAENRLHAQKAVLVALTQNT